MKVRDDESLPRVLLIGDSISIGYHLDVRSALAGVANVHRPTENGGPTSNGVEKLEEWLAEHGERPWDVIHYNFGCTRPLHPAPRPVCPPACVCPDVCPPACLPRRYPTPAALPSASHLR